jgi:hypothetical protein
MSTKSRSGAVVGVADHCGWAVLVTVGPKGAFIDRRRVELVDESLPKLPHHHDAQGLPPEQARALIERVTRSARDHAARSLEALAKTVPLEMVGIALRRCPPLPESILERITDYNAQTRADSVMYRTALAEAAAERNWFVSWYEVKSVFDDAQRALGVPSIETVLEQVGAKLGPPWQKDHRVAMAAGIAAGDF